MNGIPEVRRGYLIIDLHLYVIMAGVIGIYRYIQPFVPAILGLPDLLGRRGLTDVTN